MAFSLLTKNIAERFEKNLTFVERSISTETEDYILNVNEEEYVSHLTASVLFDIPTLHWDDISADSYEKELIEYDTFGRHRDEPFKVKRQIFQYYVPVSGDASLLYYRKANSIILDGFSLDAIFNEGCLVLEFILRGKEIVAVQNQFEKAKKGILSRYTGLTTDIEKFNNDIPDHVRLKFKERKNHILDQKNQLAALGVPIRKVKAPNSFSIPKPELRRKIEVRKPVVTEKGFKPEPALTDEHYQLILKYIDDVGKNFEQLPSLYHGKREEHLRDHILLVLDPNFNMGSATGETFNKNGKTDIILNYDSQVVFIAECKYWTGEKGFAETIDQLLSYLTWRNSKASVIMFVKENDFSIIIQKAIEATKRHSNYLGDVGESNESWFNFRFHINNDPNREVKLAIQLYHLPKAIKK